MTFCIHFRPGSRANKLIIPPSPVIRPSAACVFEHVRTEDLLAEVAEHDRKFDESAAEYARVSGDGAEKDSRHECDGNRLALHAMIHSSRRVHVCAQFRLILAPTTLPLPRWRAAIAGTAERQAEVRSVLETASVASADPSAPFYWISADWLFTWANECAPSPSRTASPPLASESLSCVHYC